MLVRLHLENFMAHASTSLDLGPGLSVLTGPNNTGKSAVVEALRCLASNPPPRSYIRHGAKEARVSAEFGDGTRVTWIRRKTYAGYEILRPGAEGPEEYYKFGRTPPREVLDILRMGPVELEGRPPEEAVDVHIGDQRYPIFLLDRPPSAIAAFFASSSESAHLLAMQDRLKNRVRLERRREAELTTRMNTLAAELDRAADLPRTALELEEAARLFSRLETLQREIPSLEHRAGQINKLRGQRAATHQRLHVLQQVRPPLEFWPTLQLSRLLQARESLQVRKRLATAQAEILVGVHMPPSLFPSRSLRDAADRLGKLKVSIDAASRRMGVLDALCAPPNLFPVAGLVDLLRRRRRMKKTAQALREKILLFGKLAPPPVLPDRHSLTALGSLAGRLRAVRKERDRQNVLLKENIDDLERIRLRAEELLDTSGTCPLCGQPMDALTFLQGDHHEPA